jgi:hypothetical protein
VIEAPRDLAGEFDVRHLVLANRHPGGAIHQDVGRLQQRIAQEPVGGEIAVGELFLLVLVGGHALEPAQRRAHRQQQMQLGVLGHPALDEQHRLFRIDAGGQPVDHHLPDTGLDDLGRVVVRRERMPVGDEEQWQGYSLCRRTQFFRAPW